MCCFFKKRKKIVKALFQSFPLVLLFSSTLTFFSLLAVLIYGSPSQKGKTANFTPQKKKTIWFILFSPLSLETSAQTQQNSAPIRWNSLGRVVYPIFFFFTVPFRVTLAGTRAHCTAALQLTSSIIFPIREVWLSWTIRMYV